MTEQELIIEEEKVLELASSDLKEDDKKYNLDTFHKAERGYLRIAKLYESLEFNSRFKGKKDMYEENAYRLYKLYYEETRDSGAYLFFLLSHFAKADEYFSEIQRVCDEDIAKGDYSSTSDIVRKCYFMYRNTKDVKYLRMAKEYFDIPYDREKSLIMLRDCESVYRSFEHDEDPDIRNEINDNVMKLCDKVISTIDEKPSDVQCWAIKTKGKFYCYLYSDTFDEKYLKLCKETYESLITYGDEYASRIVDMYEKNNFFFEEEIMHWKTYAAEHGNVEMFPKLAHTYLTEYLTEDTDGYLDKAISYYRKSAEADYEVPDALMGLIICYLNSRCDDLASMIIRLSEKLSPFEHAKLLVEFSNYVEGELKEECIEKALSESLSPIESTELYLILHNYDMREKEYLSKAVEYADASLESAEYSSKVTESYLYEMTDMGKDNFSKIKAYIEKHAWTKENPEGSKYACIDYDRLHQFMYENTSDKSYLNHAKYSTDEDGKHEFALEYEYTFGSSWRFQKYMRLNDFETYLLNAFSYSLGAYPKSYTDDVYDEGFGEVWTNAFSYQDYDSQFLDFQSYFADVYNEIILKMGLEVLFKHSKIHDFRDDSYYHDIQYYFETMTIPRYLDSNQFTKGAKPLFTHEYMYDIVFDIALNDYHFEMPKVLWAIEMDRSSEKGDKVTASRIADFIRNIDFDGDWGLGRRLAKLLNGIEHIACFMMFDNGYYDEYLKLERYIEAMSLKENDTDALGNVYYNIACYYLRSDKEHYDLEKGMHYIEESIKYWSYSRFMETDLKNDRLSELADPHFMKTMKRYYIPVCSKKDKRD